MIEIAAPLYLSAVSRLHGSNEAVLKPLKAAIYSAPYAILVFLFTDIWLALAVWGVSGACKNIGTAEGFRNKTRDNWLSRVSAFLCEVFSFERNSVYGDWVYNNLKGILIVILPSLIIAPHSPHRAASIFIFGATGYPFAYWLGFYLWCYVPYLRNRYDSYVPVAEWLSGLFAGIGFVV